MYLSTKAPMTFSRISANFEKQIVRRKVAWFVFLTSDCYAILQSSVVVMLMVKGGSIARSSRQVSFAWGPYVQARTLPCFISHAYQSQVWRFLLPRKLHCLSALQIELPGRVLLFWRKLFKPISRVLAVSWTPTPLKAISTISSLTPGVMTL